MQYKNIFVLYVIRMIGVECNDEYVYSEVYTVSLKYCYLEGEYNST